MDIFDKELSTLFYYLSKVKYIVVGDIASNLHAQTKFSPKVEIWVDVQSDNFSNLEQQLNGVYHLNYIRNANQHFDSMKFVTNNFFTV